MTQTTTAVNACDVKIQIDDQTGNLVNVSGSTNEVTLNISTDTGEMTTFEGSWKINKSCKHTATIEGIALYSTAAAEAKALLTYWKFTTPGASRTVQIDVPDGDISSDRYRGEFILTDLSIPLQSGEAKPIPISFTLLNDGEFTKTTVAT